ncbi:MAG: type I DNA topoisomerase [Candidatus Competibacteraceae bacterium]|nr:type I DNA topoisomerase [Candidatus Competibacteraceae bacterium]
MYNLIIIEAPGKVKKLRQILGQDFTIIPTKGHISDLPAKGLNVDLNNDFKPNFEVYPEKQDLVNNIVSEAKKSKVIYIASDPDREGEGIAKAIYNQLRLAGVEHKSKRIEFNSITKEAITNAIKNAREIDLPKVEAYEARRILDRLVGYKTSFLTQQATGGKSAGRTQSAGLRILAEREKEIQKFVPVVYFPIEAELETDKKEKIQATIKQPKPLDISTKEEADKIIDRIRKGPVVVSAYEESTVKNKPYAPFTTSSMYQAAASSFGWKTDKTASVAQKLYEAGACTYYRTDSVFIVPDFIKDIRAHVQTAYGQAYLPTQPIVYSNSKNAQEAHEACRVTDIGVRQYTSADADQKKLYDMIWRRTISSQMMSSEQLRISAEFSCDKYVLSATGGKMTFDGWRKVWGGGGEERYLPTMKVKDKVNVLDIKTERKETQPPPRYGSASFQKQLEQEGIGRPSTYASIVKTLEARNYITNDKNIVVTDLGLRVTDFLVTVDFCFVDLSFTSKMEDELDDVAEKKKTRTAVLQDFWNRLQKDIAKAKDLQKNASATTFPCPKCKKNRIDAFLQLKHSQFGPFFSCENRITDIKCDYKATVGEGGKPVEKVVKPKVIFDKGVCPKCGADMYVRESKFGQFAGCSKYSKGCRGMRDIEGAEIVPKKKEWKRKKGWKGRSKNL